MDIAMTTLCITLFLLGATVGFYSAVLLSRHIDL